VTFNHGVQGSNPCGLTIPETSPNAFNNLEPELANLQSRLANVCSPLFSLESLASQLGLIGGGVDQTALRCSGACAGIDAGVAGGVTNE
jgi:hypothetical protein